MATEEEDAATPAWLLFEDVDSATLEELLRQRPHTTKMRNSTLRRLQAIPQHKIKQLPTSMLTYDAREGSQAGFRIPEIEVDTHVQAMSILRIGECKCGTGEV